jgi:dTMP kinase
MTFLTQAYPGIFITFEGIDGAGKSTHIPFFAELVKEKYPDKRVILTREPGGTELGEQLRGILLNQTMDIRTEALLMFASRQEHIQTLIFPALIQGDVVICDRFTDSSFAYQCGGRGLATDQLEILEQWVQKIKHENQEFTLQPQLTLLFDLSAKVAEQRRSATRNPDKFEELDLSFFNHVRDEYLRRASAQPERFKIFDSSQSIESIQEQLHELVLNL